MVTWTPQRGSEGQTLRVCLLLADAAVPMLPRRVCSAGLRVRKCEACTQDGDTLGGLAREFGTDWLQLWGANAQVSDPGQLNSTAVPFVRLGPLYRTAAAAAEDAGVIAATFGVPAAALVAMNPDLQLAPGADGRAAAVPPDTLVCLVPSLVCAGAAAGAV